MTYLPLKEEEKQRKTYQQIIEEKNNMKTMIHSKKTKSEELSLILNS